MKMPPPKESDEANALPIAPPEQFRRLENAIADELQCLQCGAPVRDAVCGRKNPCPVCGFPYPLGDCSDLAEN